MLPYWERNIRARWFKIVTALAALGVVLLAQSPNGAPAKLAAGIAAYERKTGHEEADAVRFSPKPDELKMNLKGIFSGTTGLA